MKSKYGVGTTLGLELILCCIYFSSSEWCNLRAIYLDCQRLYRNIDFTIEHVRIMLSELVAQKWLNKSNLGYMINVNENSTVKMCHSHLCDEFRVIAPMLEQSKSLSTASLDISNLTQFDRLCIYIIGTAEKNLICFESDIIDMMNRYRNKWDTESEQKHDIVTTGVNFHQNKNESGNEYSNKQNSVRKQLIEGVISMLWVLQPSGKEKTVLDDVYHLSEHSVRVFFSQIQRSLPAEFKHTIRKEMKQWKVAQQKRKQTKSWLQQQRHVLMCAANMPNKNYLYEYGKHNNNTSKNNHMYGGKENGYDLKINEKILKQPTVIDMVYHIMEHCRQIPEYTDQDTSEAEKEIAKLYVRAALTIVYLDDFNHSNSIDMILKQIQENERLGRVDIQMVLFIVLQWCCFVLMVLYEKIIARDRTPTDKSIIVQAARSDALIKQSRAQTLDYRCFFSYQHVSLSILKIYSFINHGFKRLIKSKLEAHVEAVVLEYQNKIESTFKDEFFQNRRRGSRLVLKCFEWIQWELDILHGSEDINPETKSQLENKLDENKFCQQFNQDKNELVEREACCQAYDQSVPIGWWNINTVDIVNRMFSNNNSVIEFVSKKILDNHVPVELCRKSLNAIDQRQRGNDDNNNIKEEKQNSNDVFVSKFNESIDYMLKDGKTQRKSVSCHRKFKFAEEPDHLVLLGHMIPNMQDHNIRDILNFIKYNLEYFYAKMTTAYKNPKFPYDDYGNISIYFSYKPIFTSIMISEYDSEELKDLPDVVASGKLIINAYKKEGVITLENVERNEETGKLRINVKRKEPGKLGYRENLSQIVLKLNTCARSITELQCDSVFAHIDTHMDEQVICCTEANGMENKLNRTDLMNMLVGENRNILAMVIILCGCQGMGPEIEHRFDWEDSYAIAPCDDDSKENKRNKKHKQNKQNREDKKLKQGKVKNESKDVPVESKANETSEVYDTIASKQNKENKSSKGNNNIENNDNKNDTNGIVDETADEDVDMNRNDMDSNTKEEEGDMFEQMKNFTLFSRSMTSANGILNRNIKRVKFDDLNKWFDPVLKAKKEKKLKEFFTKHKQFLRNRSCTVLFLQKFIDLEEIRKQLEEEEEEQDDDDDDDADNFNEDEQHDESDENDHNSSVSSVSSREVTPKTRHKDKKKKKGDPRKPILKKKFDKLNAYVLTSNESGRGSSGSDLGEIFATDSMPKMNGPFGLTLPNDYNIVKGKIRDKGQYPETLNNLEGNIVVLRANAIDKIITSINDTIYSKENLAKKIGDKTRNYLIFITQDNKGTTITADSNFNCIDKNRAEYEKFENGFHLNCNNLLKREMYRGYEAMDDGSLRLKKMIVYGQIRENPHNYTPGVIKLMEKSKSDAQPIFEAISSDSRQTVVIEADCESDLEAVVEFLSNREDEEAYGIVCIGRDSQTNKIITSVELRARYDYCDGEVVGKITGTKFLLEERDTVYKKCIEMSKVAKATSENYMNEKFVKDRSNGGNKSDGEGDIMWSDDIVNASAEWKMHIFKNYGTKKYMYVANRDLTNIAREPQKASNSQEEMEHNRRGATEIRCLCNPLLARDIWTKFTAEELKFTKKAKNIKITVGGDIWRWLRYARLYNQCPNCRIISLIEDLEEALYVRIIDGIFVGTFDWFYCDDSIIKVKPEYMSMVLKDKELAERAYCSYTPQYETSDVVECQKEFIPDEVVYHTIHRGLGGE